MNPYQGRAALSLQTRLDRQLEQRVNLALLRVLGERVNSTHTGVTENEKQIASVERLANLALLKALDERLANLTFIPGNDKLTYDQIVDREA